MAEETEEPTPSKKKGGNKLVLVGICAMMLLTGGFFGLRMKPAGAAKQPEMKLGEIVPIKEFLVNLDEKGENVYLRTEISVQLAEGFQKEKLDKYTDPVKDAINNVLAGQKVDQIKTLAGKERLKRLLATAINNALAECQGEQPKATSTHIVHSDWDSDTGPILRIYFTSFAFQ